MNLTGRLSHALSYTVQFRQAGDAGCYWFSNRAQYLIYPCTQVTGESLTELPEYKLPKSSLSKDFCITVSISSPEGPLHLNARGELLRERSLSGHKLCFAMIYHVGMKDWTYVERFWPLLHALSLLSSVKGCFQTVDFSFSCSFSLTFSLHFLCIFIWQKRLHLHSHWHTLPEP